MFLPASSFVDIAILEAASIILSSMSVKFCTWRTLYPLNSQVPTDYVEDHRAHGVAHVRGSVGCDAADVHRHGVASGGKGFGARGESVIQLHEDCSTVATARAATPSPPPEEPKAVRGLGFDVHKGGTNIQGCGEFVPDLAYEGAQGRGVRRVL